MKWILKILNFYINSSIHVSFAVVALVGVTAVTLDIKQDLNLLFFVFFATITGYNFIKYSRLAKWHHLSLTESLRGIQVFSFFCFLSLLYFTFHITLEVIIGCAVMAVLTVLYALPVFSGKRSLRALPGIKIYTIGVVWAGTTVLLPVLQEDAAVNWDVWILLVQRFLFVLVITLPFDIRDMQYDDAAIVTIPARMGVKKTKMLGVLFLIILVLLEALKDKITFLTLLPTLVISIFSGVLLVLASKKQSKYYASLIVESIPLLWFLLTLIFSY
jgi:hypothetical protein